MLFFLFLLIGLVLTIFCCIVFGYDFGDFLGFFIIGSIINILLSGLIFFLASCVVTANHPSIKVIDHEKYLVSLRSSTGASGSFFLGSGYIDNSLTYFYYTGRNGIYKPNKLAMDDNDILIKYTTGKPKLVVYTYQFKSHIVGLLFVNTNADTYLFEVPKGSIKSGFSL